MDMIVGVVVGTIAWNVGKWAIQRVIEWRREREDPDPDRWHGWM
jgi:hypothetical protein